MNKGKKPTPGSRAKSPASKPKSSASQTTTRSRAKSSTSQSKTKSSSNSATNSSSGNGSMNFDTQSMLQDFLATQKMITGNYNTFAGECMHDQLRGDVLSILQDEHTIQNDIFLEMKQRGWYPVKEAPQSQIDTTKKKFQSQNSK